jgi:hypothetical protein
LHSLHEVPWRLNARFLSLFVQNGFDRHAFGSRADSCRLRNSWPALGINYFNFYGREYANYDDTNFHPNAHANSDTDTNSHADADSNSDTHTDPDSRANTFRDSALISRCAGDRGESHVH